MDKIILASISPRRQMVLEKMGIDFEVIPSDYEEDMTLNLEPSELVKFLSLGKARTVAAKNPGRVVLGGDTIVVLGNEVIGKPRDIAEAKVMLQKLSGRSHLVYTGFSLIRDSQEFSDFSQAKVYFKKLDDKIVDSYLQHSGILDKAGAYALQEIGGLLIDKMEGDFYAIVGLPIASIVEKLKDFNIDFWAKE
ncbi:MAG: nucleoside triphosphate pyrophosphatase [Patescibacteria group bacterium]